MSSNCPSQGKPPAANRMAAPRSISLGKLRRPSHRLEALLPRPTSIAGSPTRAQRTRRLRVTTTSNPPNRGAALAIATARKSQPRLRRPMTKLARGRFCKTCAAAPSWSPGTPSRPGKTKANRTEGRSRCPLEGLPPDPPMPASREKETAIASSDQSPRSINQSALHHQQSCGGDDQSGRGSGHRHREGQINLSHRLLKFGQPG